MPEPGGFIARLGRRLRHAFALAPEGHLSDEDRRLLGRIARRLEERKLTTPAILALHTASPLSFIGSQVMAALQPFVETLVSTDDYERFRRILERRDGLELFLRHLEQAADTGKDTPA